MRWIKYITVAGLLGVFVKCSVQTSERLLMPEMVQEMQADSVIVSSFKCNDNLSYVPDTNIANVDNLRLIRMNIHFMNTSDWSNNYYGEVGIKYARELVYYANRRLVHNYKMNLPEGNETIAYDPLYQYVLEKEGVFFQADDELCFYVNEGRKNNYKRDVITKHQVGIDSVLNVFYMVHHPDSVRSKTYSASGSGIALGKALKMGTVYDPSDDSWKQAGLLNHEVGHVMGLSHTWNTNDGCEDTPKHPNCWAPTATGKCKGPISNNMMDYNSNQSATTPCQIGKIRKNMARLGSPQRDLIIRTWCERDPKKDVFIDKKVHFTGAKDLSGNVHVLPGGELRISCRVSMPAGSKILVEAGGTLILDGAELHNDCGLQWEGIIVRKEKKKEGLVYKLGDISIRDTKSATL